MSHSVIPGVDFLPPGSNNWVLLKEQTYKTRYVVICFCEKSVNDSDDNRINRQNKSQNDILKSKIGFWSGQDILLPTKTKSGKHSCFDFLLLHPFCSSYIKDPPRVPTWHFK